MTIDVSDLIRKKLFKKEVHLILDSESFSYENEDFHFSKPVKLDGTISYIGDILNLEVEVCTELVMTCSRCLEDFTYDVNIKIDERFSNNIDNKDDEDIIFIESDIIDITDIIENNIEMALPIKKLCNDECKGLCPNCGTNLNISSCNCNDNNIDIRLAKLRDLFSTK